MSAYKKRISMMKLMAGCGAAIMLAGFALASFAGFDDTSTKLSLLGLLILILGLAAYMIRKASWSE